MICGLKRRTSMSKRFWVMLIAILVGVGLILHASKSAKFVNSFSHTVVDYVPTKEMSRVLSKEEEKKTFTDQKETFSDQKEIFTTDQKETFTTDQKETFSDQKETFADQKETLTDLQVQGQVDTPKPFRIVPDGENIKVGEHTEVHVLSAITRGDYPRANSFNVLLFTWTGSRKTDRRKFVCCLSDSRQFTTVIETPAFKAFEQPGFPTVDMRYILHSCSLNHTQLPRPAKHFRYVAFAEASCDGANMTRAAHEIIEPRDGRGQFAVCKSFAYGELDPRQLVEWFEFAKVVGVSVVQVHYNNISEDALTVLRYYQKQGILIMAPANPAAREGYPSRGFFVRDVQKFMDKRVILNDCLHRLSGYEYVGVVDFDELLMPVRPFDTLLEVLRNATKRYPKTGVFYAHAHLNLLHWPDTDSSAAISFMRRMDRTHSDSIDSVMGQRSSPKIIYDPQRMEGVETHTVTAFRGDYDGRRLPRESYRLVHFRSCKKSAWKTCDFDHSVDPEMLRFRTRWLQGISRVPLLDLSISKEYQQNITSELVRLSTEN